MTTRAQRFRTRKAHLAARYGADHPVVAMMDDQLALHRAAAAIIRNRRASWTDQQRTWLRQLVDGYSPLADDLTAPVRWNARASGPASRIPGDGDGP